MASRLVAMATASCHATESFLSKAYRPNSLSDHLHVLLANDKHVRNVNLATSVIPRCLIAQKDVKIKSLVYYYNLRRALATFPLPVHPSLQYQWCHIVSSVVSVSFISSSPRINASSTTIN